jgi:hypothetical protein
LSATVILNTTNQIYDQLDSICKAGLEASLNKAAKIYDLQIMNREWHNTGEYYPTEDLTSTAICLIGISRAKLSPELISLDVNETMSAMNSLARRRAYLGGFGLVLWANAVCGGEDLATLQASCGIKIGSVKEFVSKLTTMEVAWLVSGLAHEYNRSNDNKIRTILKEACLELIDRRFQVGTQTVSHTGEGVGFPENIRRWIANCADQVYSIQALAFAAIVLGDERSKNISECLANQMIAFQGKKGQWWWHYDAKRGGSPQPYSVYSVHQHGMAPMALHALAKANGKLYRQAIDLSIGWLTDNELGINMIDTRRSTIWRSIEYKQNQLKDKFRKSMSLTGVAGDQSKSPPPELQVNYETRPYEWAWCIYAGAIQREIPAESHIV